MLLQALPPGKVLDWLYLDRLCISGILEAVVVVLTEWLNLDAVELLCTVSGVRDNVHASNAVKFNPSFETNWLVFLCEVPSLSFSCSDRPAPRLKSVFTSAQEQRRQDCVEGDLYESHILIVLNVKVVASYISLSVS